MKTSNIQKKAMPKVILLCIVFLLSALIFAVLAQEVVIEGEDWFDTKVFSFFEQYSTPAFINFFNRLTFFGSLSFLLPAYGILIIYLIWKRRRQEAVDIIFVGLSSAILMYTLKLLYSRARPEMPLIKMSTSFSFPSGHAFCSFVFCCVLIYHVWKINITKPWKWFFTILLLFTSITIGISRVVLRYHYASDVLAGLCLGSAWFIFSLWLESKLRIKPPTL